MIQPQRVAQGMESVNQLDERVGGNEFTQREIIVNGDVPSEHDLPQLAHFEAAHLNNLGQGEERAQWERLEHQLEPSQS